ncbi:hypothetical protein JCM3775_004207 [Rhodotorula graminis]
MALDEKPLLPHSQVPPSSKASGVPPSIVLKPRRTSTTPSFARNLAAKRRWLVAFAVYAIVGMAWHSRLPSLVRELDVKMPAALHWPRPYAARGGRVVYNALGEPSSFNRSFARLHFAPGDDEDDREGSTPLGPAADDAYHLFPPGADPSLAEYLSTLETFLRTHFPPADTDESDPSSLINAMRSYFPTSPTPRWPAGLIPRKVWQTAPDTKYFASRESSTRTWLANNPGWKVERQDNEAADRWVLARFSLGKEDDGYNSSRGVIAAWDRLVEPGVLRSDFWRYLVLAVDGGVYADTDVDCLKPFNQWAYDASWEGTRPSGWQPPALIVGVESDVGNRADWNQYWPRPLQITQWTMAAARGHPVLVDAVRRVVETALMPEQEQPRSIMERSGPGLWTDSVLSYLWVMYRRSWPTFRGLDSDGWRFRASADASQLLIPAWAQILPHLERWGDVKMLSITGFSPGIGHMGAHDKSHPAAMAVHGFAGSWRKQRGAEV